MESESNHIEKDRVNFFVNLSVAPTPRMDKNFVDFVGITHFLIKIQPECSNRGWWGGGVKRLFVDVRKICNIDSDRLPIRQHCRLTICIELVELTNSETAATTPSGGGRGKKKR